MSKELKNYENNENAPQAVRDANPPISSKEEKSSKKKKGTTSKKTAPKKGKLMPEMYKNSNFQKLPKIPKAMLKDIDKMPVMTMEQMEKYLTAVALGIIPERFGMESSLDTRMKAMQELNKMKQQEQLMADAGEEERQITEARKILYSVKEPTLNESNVFDDIDEEDEEEIDNDANAA